MITYLPYPNPVLVRRTLVDQDRMASGLAAFKILEGRDGVLPEAVRLWQNDHPLLARYGVMLDVFPRAEVFILHLTGAPWEPPAWLTNEVCASHRSHLKYLGLMRNLCDRINRAFDSVEGWCTRNGFGRYWTVEDISLMHEILDSQNVSQETKKPDYSDFDEEAAPELLWPWS